MQTYCKLIEFFLVIFTTYKILYNFYCYDIIIRDSKLFNISRVYMKFLTKILLLVTNFIFPAFIIKVIQNTIENMFLIIRVFNFSTLIMVAYFLYLNKTEFKKMSIIKIRSKTSIFKVYKLKQSTTL